MIRNHKKTTIFSLAVAALLVYLLAPVYVFVGESRPQLFSPLGSFQVEESKNLDSIAAAGWENAAARASELIRNHRNRIQAPALSAAIAIDGQLIWAAATGYSVLENKIPASTETLFRIGSTSKAVTGTLMARLVDAGVVSLDKAIDEYSGALPNSAWDKLTLRQLASHTAGIAGYENNTDWFGTYRSFWPRRHYDNVADTLEYFDESESLFAPGTDFYYSSYDVVLQSAVLQDAAGLSYQQLLHDWVREPLAIRSPLPDAPHADRTRHYFLHEGRAYASPVYDVSHRMAGGGLMARPRDMALLGTAWLDSEFISAPTREQFFTAQRLENGELNEQLYALNWRVRDTVSSDIPLFNANHGGVGKGAMSWLIVVPAHKLALSMMINTRIEPFPEWVAIQEELIPLFLSTPALY